MNPIFEEKKEGLSLKKLNRRRPHHRVGSRSAGTKILMIAMPCKAHENLPTLMDIAVPYLLKKAEGNSSTMRKAIKSASLVAKRCTAWHQQGRGRVRRG